MVVRPLSEEVLPMAGRHTMAAKALLHESSYEEEAKLKEAELPCWGSASSSTDELEYSTAAQAFENLLLPTNLMQSVSMLMVLIPRARPSTFRTVLGHRLRYCWCWLRWCHKTNKALGD